MEKNYCFIVAEYTYTDDDVEGKDIIRKPGLTLVQALDELAKYVASHPDCYATADGFLSEHDDESIMGVSGFNEKWSAFIALNEEE